MKKEKKEKVMEGVVEEFIIKRNSMIIKNTTPIDTVYKMDKKVLGSGTYGTVNKVTHIVNGQ